MNNRKWLDRISNGTIVLTIVLFIVSVFVHGLSHELLLETGVLLVSIKLILSSAKTSNQLDQILKRLDNK